ncbi:Asp23/Gls24 family envelope stress response protein [Priestia megaterium]|uniref:Asp23/Gls24 family envelope stress response protein n=1 Tax=Priestia megaterium TaxID=1404 RepID=UPI0026E2DE68|nr:Asp23/Gls24 family envelope stress response protein [Priestia megaterium]MDO6848902.1 Asp23/Gls24 family envelope stress response protein [Priestia megaterium]
MNNSNRFSLAIIGIAGLICSGMLALMVYRVPHLSKWLEKWQHQEWFYYTILSMSGGFMSGLTDRFRSTEDITKGINAEVGEKQVALDLKVIVEYGKNVPAIFSEIVNNVKKSVHDMTGLEVVEVNMHVEDVMTRSEFEAKTDRDKEQESKHDLE